MQMTTAQADHAAAEAPDNYVLSLSKAAPAANSDVFNSPLMQALRIQRCGDVAKAGRTQSDSRRQSSRSQNHPAVTRVAAPRDRHGSWQDCGFAIGVIGYGIRSRGKPREPQNSAFADKRCTTGGNSKRPRLTRSCQSMPGSRRRWRRLQSASPLSQSRPGYSRGPWRRSIRTSAQSIPCSRAAAAVSRDCRGTRLSRRLN